MALKPTQVEDLLQGKFGFSPAPRSGQGRREDSHKWFELGLPGLPKVRTKVSRNRKDIGPGLEARMARELHVRPAFYRLMMGCQRSREDYYGQIKVDPFPPFRC